MGVRLFTLPLLLVVGTGALVGLDHRRVAGSRSAAAVSQAEDTGAGRESRALPWLHNFAVAAETAEATPEVVARMARWREPDESCSAAAYGGLAITADVAKAHGPEAVLASFTQGVLVLDAGGRLLASATALPCQGSADEIDGIAAGDAHIDRPVIALAVTTGGRRASSTWLVLYGVTGGVIAPLFTGRVEDHDGERTQVGAVLLLPGALLYRAPTGTQTMWVYNTEQQRYVELALVVPPAA